MEKELSVLAPHSSELMSPKNDAELRAFRMKCQLFVANLNRLPPGESVGKTADEKALTIYISHIEMTLDEMFFGLWDTVNFKWSQIANEVVGSLELVVTHPVTLKDIRRTGAAAIQIMVDKVPEEFQYNANDSRAVAAQKAKDRNKWALDVENKKPAALDMSFPKLKAECVKNAAQSLGKLFGRDLNRKDNDNFRGLLKPEENGQPDNSKSSEVVKGTEEALKKAAAKKTL